MLPVAPNGTRSREGNCAHLHEVARNCLQCRVYAIEIAFRATAVLIIGYCNVARNNRAANCCLAQPFGSAHLRVAL